jgi:hypothetical protein
MSVITVKCPRTGLAISTGIETDRNSFDQLPDVLSHTHCPLCGLQHRWWKREAWLSGPSEQPKATNAA